MSLKQFSVSLTDDQRKSLSKGKTVLLRPDQMMGGEITLALQHQKHKKVCKACRLGKGMKLSLTPDEYKTSEEISGGKLSWKGFVRDMKKVGHWYKKNLGKNTEFGNVVRSGLTKLADAAGSTLVPAATLALTGNPAAAAAASALSRPLLKKGVQAIGDATGGYGVHVSTVGGFLPSSHPAMNPAHVRIPPKEPSVHTQLRRGGSFVAAGYGIQSGFPNHPTRHMSDFRH